MQVMTPLGFGALKPVGLTDPQTGRRPWAALQLRAEDVHGSCYNLVGFQTNLAFPEQRRVFRMIPGLENAEFARYGVMHRNTFVDAPRLLDDHLRLRTAASEELGIPVYVAGQLAGTEGYCEAIRSGLHVPPSPLRLIYVVLTCRRVPREMVFGSLLAYATDPPIRLIISRCMSTSASCRPLRFAFETKKSVYRRMRIHLGLLLRCIRAAGGIIV